MKFIQIPPLFRRGVLPAPAMKPLVSCALLVLGACTSAPLESPQTATPAPSSATPTTPIPAESPAPAPAPTAVAPPPTPAVSNLEDYKRVIAHAIARFNAASLYEGPPPPMLKSVVVLTLAIDREGLPRRVSVMRSNGYRALEAQAVSSVKAAAPFPKPGRLLAKSGVAEFNETWLFREDGRFQIRSIAEAQSDY